MSEMGDSGGSGEVTEISGEQDAGTESTAETSSGSGAEAPGGEAGESGPADADARDGPDAAAGQPEGGGAADESGTDAVDAASETGSAAETGDESGASGTEPGENGPAEASSDKGPGDSDAEPPDSDTAGEGDGDEIAVDIGDAEPGDRGPDQSDGIDASRGAEDSRGHESSAESTAEANGESASEAPVGEPGEGEPVDAGPDEGSRPSESDNDTGANSDTITEAEPIDEISDESGTGNNDAEPGENGPAGTDADDIVAGTAAQSQDSRSASEAARADPAVMSGPAGADNQSPLGQVAERDRPDISMKYPSDYKESDAPPPTVDGPHQSPETWARDINPGRSEVGGNVNCGECARAVQETWSGDASVAATMTPGRNGEPASRMNEWAGSSPQQATINQVSDRLKELGPGSSAIVRCHWNDNGGAHYFNSTNDGGTIKAVDGQSGRVESWPPSRAGLGFDESDMSSSLAFYFDSNGRAVR